MQNMGKTTESIGIKQQDSCITSEVYLVVLMLICVALYTALPPLLLSHRVDDASLTGETSQDYKSGTTEIFPNGDGGRRSDKENGNNTNGVEGRRSDKENGNNTNGDGGRRSDKENGNNTNNTNGDGGRRSDKENGNNTNGDGGRRSDKENGNNSANNYDNEKGDKAEDDPLVVHTKLGPIRGIKRDGVRVFHGVRFAQAPVNDLRWMPPQPAQSWEPDVYDGTWVRPGCPQKCQPTYCPQNITLAGHSAGALSVVYHLTNPETAALFRHVILSSAPLTLPYRDAPGAVTRGQHLARKLACLSAQDSTTNMTCLRQKTVQDIRAAEDSMAAASSPAMGALLDSISPWSPVIDGDTVKSSPLDAFLQYADNIASKKSVFKPMIVGTASDEAYLFINQISQYRYVGPLYQVFLSSATGVSLNDLAELYPVGDSDDVQDDMITILTDFIFRCPLRSVLHHLTSAIGQSDVGGVWAYLWRRPMGGHIPEDMAFCRGKSCHGAELPFLFRTFDRLGLQPKGVDLKLSGTIMDYVSNFVATGDPNTHAPSREDIPINNLSKETRSIKDEYDFFGSRKKVVEGRSANLNRKKRGRRKRRNHNTNSAFSISSRRRPAREIVKRHTHGRSTKDPVTGAKETDHPKLSVDRGDFRKDLPYWSAVTGPAGVKEDPTWLNNALNFLKNKVKMETQGETKGKQCDMWDETKYTFPNLFG
ncbi:carboxylic ester hydrolase [Plakobranchus ocellatus]|uniref:Carboxylic ester hydrolase n=1 Tax=Plakobranchus ocellatus TaxID=259542 RepID=A0AAV4BV88_9GAST|nr:carboxylic ester hydrolase [Plakobranchus ocellatus]